MQDHFLLFFCPSFIRVTFRVYHQVFSHLISSLYDQLCLTLPPALLTLDAQGTLKELARSLTNGPSSNQPSLTKARALKWCLKASVVFPSLGTALNFWLNLLKLGFLFLQESSSY